MPASRPYAPPPHRGLDILLQDASFLVVNKPSGLLSVPGRGAEKADSLSTRVQAEYADALVVHRLDMETSGLVVLARGAEAQRRLSAFFRERRVVKHYVAVVAGLLRQTAGEIDLPLLTDWPNRPRQKVDWQEGKPCLTRFRVLGHDPQQDTTRVELEPVTGRSHQLRVHLCTLGHPILGDPLYAPFPIREQAGRLLLHAAGLQFPHPLTGAPVSCVCDPAF